MRTCIRSATAALAAALVLAAAVGTAAAARLEVSNRGIRIVWEGVNELKFEEAEGVIARCAVIMEGTFHSRTFAKVTGTLIGYITRARAVRPCNTGEASFLNGTEGIAGETNRLPWHFKYTSIAGTLPRIEEIWMQVIGLAFLIRMAGGLSCLYQSTTTRPAMFIAYLAHEGGAQTGTVTELLLAPGLPIPKSSGSLFCLNEVALNGYGRVTLLETLAAIRFALIA
jgi:hypothetical protein